jgi:host factor-I protein
MDKDAGVMNVQDQYLTRARKDRSWLTVFLNSGKKIGGRVVSFDRYTVILEDRGHEQMVFKHAIATITASRSFANSIHFDGAKTGKERDGRGPARAGDAPRKGGGPTAVATAADGDATRAGDAPSGAGAPPPGPRAD